MLWIETVRSIKTQPAKITVSPAAQSAAEAAYGIFSSIWAASAHMVPNTATIATANQYTGAMYLRTKNCSASETTMPTPPIATATYGSIVWTRWSDSASPMAVVTVLTAQKGAVMTGTFLIMCGAAMLAILLI